MGVKPAATTADESDSKAAALHSGYAKEAALRALLLAKRARHGEELAAARNEAERLTAIIKALQRHQFGRRSERLDPDQLALALEDVEQTLAAVEAAAERQRRESR